MKSSRLFLISIVTVIFFSCGKKQESHNQSAATSLAKKGPSCQTHALSRSSLIKTSGSKKK